MQVLQLADPKPGSISAFLTRDLVRSPVKKSGESCRRMQRRLWRLPQDVQPHSLEGEESKLCLFSVEGEGTSSFVVGKDSSGVCCLRSWGALHDWSFRLTKFML
jgi:hypothetical protein